MLDIRQVHQLEPFAHRADDFFVAHVRVLAQRKSDVLEHGHRVEQCAALKKHPELLPYAVQILLRKIGNVFFLDDDTAGVGSFEAEHVPKRHRLARARTAKDDHDLAAIHSDVRTAQNLFRSVCFVDVLKFDEGLAGGPPPLRRPTDFPSAIR